MSTVNQSVSQLPLFPVGSPVLHSVLPGSAEARMMTVTSGRRCLELYKSSSPLGRCVRMLLVTSTWGSKMRYLTWKVRAMKHSRFLFQLAVSAPSTRDTEYLLLPTPVSEEGGYNKSPGENAKIRPGLQMMARKNLWPTPNVCGNHNRKGASKTSGDGLSTAVKMFPSPKSRDYRTGDKLESRRAREKLSGNWHSPDLNDVAAPGGQLNPAWVEWLQGFPPGWTNLTSPESQQE